MYHSQLSVKKWVSVVCSLAMIMGSDAYSVINTSNGGRRSEATLCKVATTMALDPSVLIPQESEEEEESIASPKVGVLLLNLGGPEKSEDVEGFLFNLFADPDIIRLPKFLTPFQNQVATFISKRRAPKSRAAYESIGGGSPILKYTNAQADLLTQSLKEKHGLQNVKTYIGMRYWYPFTEEALDEIQKDNVNALVIVPLYPQFSISTSGSSLRVLQEEFAKHADKWVTNSDMTHTVISSWYERPGYVNAMANLINEQLNSFTEEQLEEGRAASVDGKITRHVLFSAHGVPQSYIAAGDPYQRQIEECVDKISQLLPVNEDVKVHLSYQSRVGPIEWLRPYTDDVLPQLGEEENVKNLVVVPISFVSEHIETLEEIDIEYRELAEEYGVTNWKRCPALNTDANFINDMSDMIVQALNEPSLSVTEACVANNVADLLDEEQLQLERLGINNAGVAGVGKSTTDLEKWNGRLAIVAILLTIAFEQIFNAPLLPFGQ